MDQVRLVPPIYSPIGYSLLAQVIQAVIPLKMNRTPPHRRSRAEPAPVQTGAGIHPLFTMLRYELEHQIS